MLIDFAHAYTPARHLIEKLCAATENMKNNIDLEKKHTGGTAGTLITTHVKRPQEREGDKVKRNTTNYGKSSVINSDLKVLKLPTICTTVSTDMLPVESRYLTVHLAVHTLLKS